MSSGKWRPSCLGLNVLMSHSLQFPDELHGLGSADKHRVWEAYPI